MCGLAGWTSLPRSAPPDAVLGEMAGALAQRNRGAPLVGVIDCDARRHVGLAASHADAVSRISLALDGSLANFQEIRKELEKRGYRFASNSHEELLLRAYQHWDKDVAKHLLGAFAFAIWDARKERLLLARDRFGEKPLYLHEKAGGLFFASEAKALLEVPGAGGRVDAGALWDCLAARYVPGPRTLFEGIRKLAPGTYVTWQLGRLQEVRYWFPPDRQAFSGKGAEDTEEQFSAHLQEAIRLRAGGGVLLSGGIDSAAMVAVLAANGASVRTFTFGVEGDAKSELAGAAAIAKHFGTQHREIVLSAKDLVPGLERMIAARDAPVARPSELAVHALVAQAGREAGVLLSGDGCDEILGGYRSLILPSYARWEMNRNRDEIRKISTSKGGEGQDPKQPPYDADPNASELRRRLYFRQARPLPDELLERADRAAVLAGVEVRMPYLDHRLAEYVSSLPDERRVSGFATKRILREAARRLLPPGLGPLKKGGFRIPIRDWLRNDLRDTLLEHLAGGSSLTRKHYDAAKLDRMLDEHARGKNDWSRPLWTLLNLEIWHRRYARG
ncbi:MAG: asparagine synthase (glutamine-hydrolyzing) [Clostridia bacterium]